MKRGPKVLLIAIAGLIALIALTMVLLAFFFPAERAKGIAVARLEASLRRPVSIAQAHVRVIPFRVSLEGIRIGAGAPAPNEPTVSIASLRVGIRLLPLLRRQIDVSGIDIDRPVVQMILSKEAAPPREPTARPAAGPPMSLRVQRLAVTGGAVSILLADGSPFVHLGGLSEDLAASVSGAGTVDVKGEIRIDTLRVQMTGTEIGRGIRIRLEHDLRYEAAKDLLSVRKGLLHMGNVPIAVEGDVAGLQSPEPVLNLSLEGGPAEIREIFGLIPVKMLPAAVGDVRSSGTLRVEGIVRGSAKRADFTVDLSLEDGRIEAGAMLAQPVEGIRLNVRARPDTIDIREFAARSARTSVRGRVTLIDYRSDPLFRLAAEADLDLAALSSLLVPPDSMKLGGSASARVLVEGRTREPQKATIDGLVRFSSVRAEGKALPQPLTDGNGDLLLQGQTVGLRGFSLKLGSSDLGLNGTIVNPLALIPAPEKGNEAGTPVSSGRVRFDLEIRSGFLDLNPYLGGPRRQPTITLPPGDGVISLSCDHLLAQKIDARNVRGRAIVDHGVIRLDGFGMQTLGGTVSLDGTLDMGATAAVAAPPSEGAKPSAPAVAAPLRSGPKLDIVAHAQNIGVTDLFTLSPALDRFGRVGGFLTGGLSARATLQGLLNDSLALDLPTLMSNGNLEIQNAKLSDQPIQKSIAGFLNMPQLNNAAVSEWKQTFTIENGRLNIKGLSVRAGEVELTASGWQAIDGTMQMNFDLMLPRQFSQQIAAKLPADAAAVLMTGADPRLYVPLTLTGKTSAPSVVLNSGQISLAAKAQAEARLKEEKARLAEEARRQAEQLLQRRIGLPADSTRGGSPLDSLTIKKDVLKRLGGFLGK